MENKDLVTKRKAVERVLDDMDSLVSRLQELNARGYSFDAIVEILRGTNVIGQDLFTVNYGLGCFLIEEVRGKLEVNSKIEVYGEYDNKYIGTAETVRLLDYVIDPGSEENLEWLDNGMV